MFKEFDILLVVVLYQEHLLNTCTYKTLIALNDSYDVFVYDNSTENQSSIKDIPSVVYYEHNPQNPGLSYAYNKAAEYADFKGYRMILLLDQDTTFREGAIESYKKAIQENADIKLFCPAMMVEGRKFISPVKIYHHSTRLSDTVPKGQASTSRYTAINSGLLIDVKAFLSIGGYNEKVRLDYSDFQFFERFSEKYKEFFVVDMICNQSFSAQVQNSSQKLRRFEIFCECLKNCEKKSLLDKIDYQYIVLKRAINLCLQTKTIKPLIIYTNKYL